MSCHFMHDDEVVQSRSNYVHSMHRCPLGRKRVKLLGVFFQRRQRIFIRGKMEVEV